MEVDSLNVVILVEDVVLGMEEFGFFIKEVCWEMIIKVGQKCIVICCIIVLEQYLEDVQLVLSVQLVKMIVGDLWVEGV